jgi:hypothetical protein
MSELTRCSRLAVGIRHFVFDSQLWSVDNQNMINHRVPAHLITWTWTYDPHQTSRRASRLSTLVYVRSQRVKREGQLGNQFPA